MITNTSLLSTTMSPSTTTISPISTTTSPPTTTTSPTTTASTTASTTTSTSSCIWTSWVDASQCHFDQNVGNGFRFRTRCCTTQNGSDNLDPCNDEKDVMECTPRECIDHQCNCNLSGESFGLKNGNCSGKNLGIIYRIYFDYRCDHLLNPQIPILSRH